MTWIWLGLPTLWLGVVTSIIFCYRRELGRLWREPVLRWPVLVLESDDWGAGPLDQASALDDISAILRRFSDSTGRPAVMSLAVVLAVPNGRAIASCGNGYSRICLDEPMLSPVLGALKRGEAQGAFSLQLHGLEHYWPESLMACADSRVQAWLRAQPPASTERLPSYLQSRWVDASCLPSRPLGDVQRAVAEEVEVYRRVFGRSPTLVVPPTFVWTPAVEHAWAAQGIECVITPGCRYVARAADGSSVADDARFANGDSTGGITYLVRYDYFEPARGRDAAYAQRALRRASAEGRPCVLENHRINFCQGPALCAHSLGELQQLLAGALAVTPRLRFLSSGDLFNIMKTRDAQWIASRWRERLPFIWQRLRQTGRLWKLLRLTGATFLGELLIRWAGPTPAAVNA